MPERPGSKRRRRAFLAVAAVLLGLRALLPIALRPILVAQADRHLAGHVELGDLDLSLLRGGVTLHDFSLHHDERPAEAPPRFEAKRLWTQISWLALLSRTVEIEELELEGFVLRVDRDAEGFWLPGLAPQTAPTEATPADDESEGEPWAFNAEAISLFDGRVEFVDHTARGGPEKLEIAVADLSARELAVRADPEDDEPGRISVEAMLDQGSLGLTAWIQSSAQGLDVRATLVLDDLPIDRLRTYLTAFDWRTLAGRLDATLDYRREPGGPHDLKGKLALADLAIGVADLDAPALAWKNLSVVIDELDVAKRHVEIGALDATGARLLIEPRAEIPIPWLRRPRPTDAAEQANAGPEADGSVEPAWSWRVGRAALADAVVELRGTPTPVPIAVEGELEDLSSTPESKGMLALRTSSGDGSLRFSGEIAASPFRVDGRLAIDDLELRPFTAQLEGPGLHWLQSARLRADLLLGLGEDLRAAGSLGLAGLVLEEPETKKQFAVAWKDLELALTGLALRDPFDRLEHAAARPLVVALSRARFVDPRIVLTRDEQGLFLPPLVPVPLEAESEAAASEATDPTAPVDAVSASPDPTDARAEPEDPESGTASPIELALSIADLRIDAGRLELADPQIEPAYHGRIELLTLAATGVRWPQNEIDELALTAEGLRGAKLSAQGRIAPDKTRIEGELVDLALGQFNAYLSGTGYDVRDGRVSLKTRTRIGTERVSTRNELVLAGLDVGGAEGEAAFLESFGVPLSVALSLLEDFDGRISLSLPVSGKPEKLRVGIARLVGQALRKALVGALAAPLKLLGAVTRAGKVESFAPAPIPFVPAESRSVPEAAERIEDLARLLAGSPGIAVVLTGHTSAGDDRLLCERALLAQLEASRGLRALSELGEIGRRRAVRRFLASKLAGQSPPPLSRGDARWLESELAHASAPREVLEALARSRADALRTALERDHGIAAKRITIGAPVVSPPAEDGGVEVSLAPPPMAVPQNRSGTGDEAGTL